MSLARVYAKLSRELIRRLNTAGGPRADQVDAELDNLIAWASAAPRCIHRDTTTVGNVGAGSDTLHTFSLPAGSLATDGDYLSVWYGGIFADNSNSKTLLASFGGTGYENGGGLAFDDDIGWTINARIIRLSATTVRVNHFYLANQIFASAANAVNTFSAAGFFVSRTTGITVPNLDSNATTMLVQGTGTADNDIVQSMSIIELCQQ